MLLVVLAIPTFAQKDYQFRVSSFMSEDASIIHTYNYADPTGCDLRNIHKVDLLEDPSYEAIDSLHYDENGNIIRLATHQLLDGSYEFVCYLDYTYNEMNLRATRKNYNIFDGVPELGGTYYYNYNEQGQMTDWLLNFVGIDYQKCILTYNEDGLLVNELYQENPFTGVFENSAKVDYFYNGNNYLTEIHEYSWSLELNDWEMQKISVKEYDELGNCTLEMTTTPSGTPQSKYVYKYDEKVLAEDIYFYENPEGDFPLYPQMHNMLTSFEFWALDQNSNDLVYVIDYLVGYELIGELELNVVAEASQDTICLGETIELTAKVNGGTGDYTFSWTPADMLDDAEAQTTTATPTEAGEYTFTVTVDDGIDQVEASVTVFVNDCTGVEEQVLNNVNIYPNPAQDFIMIDSENVEYVEVIDIYGRVITSSEINGETRIEMSDFADGIYYVRLHSNGATAVQKVVKN